MKKVLGLDLGTNSIGWALIEIDHKKGIVRIEGIGTRILPMNADEVKDFERSGKIKSTAAQRTERRGSRRLNERYLLRRDRLHLVLNLLNALPEHYKLEIDYNNEKGEKCGKFKKNKEPKLAYLPRETGEKSRFLFMDSYQEMLIDIKQDKIENVKGKRIPFDWTLYYLRQKALYEKITLEELAWVLLSYNQKRGYEKTEVEDKSTKENEIVEEFDLQVKKVIPKVDNNEKPFYEIHLDGNDNFIYNEFASVQMTFKEDLKEIIKTSKVDEHGNIVSTEFRIVDIYSMEITDVNYEKEDGKHKYTLTYQNGWQETKYPRNFTFKYKNAINKTFDYIVETVYDKEGKIKNQQGKERKLREPNLNDSSNDWTLLKKKTEKEALVYNAEKFGKPKKYISPKIYNTLKKDAITGKRTKIIGGMFQVVDRDFYREELKKIIAIQKQFHISLEDKEIFEKCVKTLYPKNKNHQEVLLKNKDAIQQLLVEDILLFQRPLKSKKSEIANCKYEIQYWQKSKNKEGLKTPIYHKVVSKSHPYYQEFRIWDKLHNLKLIQLEDIDKETGEILTNQDVTKKYFNTEKEYQDIFEELNNRKSLNQEQFLKYCKEKLGVPHNKRDTNFVWNFPEEEEINGNELRVSFATRFKRCGFANYTEFLTQEKELDLWHYLYSVNYKERTVNENKSATTFFNRFLEGSNVTDEVKQKIIKDFVNYPKFSSKYCAFSEKALKKLLPLIRLNEQNKKNQWEKEKWYLKWKESLVEREKDILRRIKNIDLNAEKIDYSNVVNTRVDVEKGEIPLPKGLFNSFREFKNIEEFKQLNLTLASYLVYGRHSELAQAKHWISPTHIREELHQELKQHSLNNPVAEKVLLEMMQVVADIWDYYGNGAKNFFSEIHLEVGRDLKKSAQEKESETKRMSENRIQNKRIRQVLEEFFSNANPKNSDHFERMKIVEEGAEHTKNTDKSFFDNKTYTKKEIDDILKKPSINKADFEKYKLWIEQGYKSPYTNLIIKHADLFDGNKYNIDHVFPQALITNNSLSNKVVCECEINKLKSDKTGRGFINNPKQSKMYCVAHGKEVAIVSDDDYVKTVKTQFSGTKRYILLSKEIPREFTNSQLNNARHIARKAMELLSHVVREQDEVEFRSKKILPVTGKVTSELKRAWKMDQIWRGLVAPRYMRMNMLTKSNLFGDYNISKSGQKYFDCKLDDCIRTKDESYNIKRIDHRHHALDALIVALCTEEHVNYINNINANSTSFNYLNQKRIEKYRQALKRKIMYAIPNKEKPNEKNWELMLPGEIREEGAESYGKESVLNKSYYYKNFDSFQGNYMQMVLTALQHTVVTFKQNMRIINKTINNYESYKDDNGNLRFGKDGNPKKDFVSQKSTNWVIRRSLSKDTFYGKKRITGEDRIVIRKDLDTSFDRAKIKTITDTGIQKILINHLKQFDTIELSLDDAITYYDALFEKAEIESIINNEENNFQNLNDFCKYLKLNKYRYDKVDYSKLNVFIDKTTSKEFRKESKFVSKIKEHPNIAFSPAAIEEMNTPKNLIKLNEGKNHTPIKKVRISRGFGSQRSLNEENKLSVKSKQYVISDSGSNLYLGFYERSYIDNNGDEVRERKFKDIGLRELIETLKQDKNNRHHPLPEKIYDEKQNELFRIFTLSPSDLVYVPTDIETLNHSEVDFSNLTKEQMNRIYKYVDGSEEIANFVPYNISKPIWRFHGKKNEEVFKELKEKNKITINKEELIQNEFGLGSQQNKNQNMIDGETQIKKICWKLKLDRLGNIIGVEK
jgi:CRISPR-associated endonuclease Csn1